jgi:hypothetical protein
MSGETTVMLSGFFLAAATAKALVARGILSRDDLLEDLYAKALGVEDPTIKAAFDDAITAVKSMAGPT